MKSLHNSHISILKAILIILVVIGHSGCAGLFLEFIYLFHMPAFFFISGFLFKEKHLNSFKSFFLRKMISLYLPFVIWSTIILALTNVFFRWGVLDYSLEARTMVSEFAKVLLFAVCPFISSASAGFLLQLASLICLFIGLSSISHTNSVIQRFSRYSYTIYLTHFIFIRALFSLFPGIFSSHFLMPVLMAAIVAVAEYFFCLFLENCKLVPDKVIGI